jgi:hypothetical protein
MTEKAICVHGHFYQPPREDPITGEIPVEAGAAPYENWNERIYAQCYKPNAELGNFERISFNVGPTLFSWIHRLHPKTYEKIITQERKNYEKDGVGNGLAQAYNHTILPLASYEDKRTQIIWGIADFEHRFGHRPAGLWLPETAVDEETLQVLADCGVQFTILAPWQAATEVIDSTQPYWVNLQKGSRIAVFFYQKTLSERVSFDPGSTINADRFVDEAVLPGFRSSQKPEKDGQLAIIASDGELYGHHQPFRDQFLSYLLSGAIDNKKELGINYPGAWLKQYPPTGSVFIKPGTSWSCTHGIRRWRDACGCTPNASWKAPLRQAFNQTAKLIDEQFVKALLQYNINPWNLRNAYIHVRLGDISLEQLLNEQNGGPIPGHDISRIALLLEAQFERQRMFTSCGWFFEDFDRIEPRNNVAYAAQAVWLTYQAIKVDLSADIKRKLSRVESGRTGLRADQVFDQYLERAKGLYPTNDSI